MKRKMQKVLLACCLSVGQHALSQNLEIDTMPLSELKKNAVVQASDSIFHVYDLTQEEKIQQILSLPSERRVIKDGKIMVEVYFKELSKNVEGKLTSIRFDEKVRRDNIVLGWVPLENLPQLFEIEALEDVVVPEPIQTHSNSSWEQIENIQARNRQLTNEQDEEEGNPNNVYGFGEALNQSIASMKVEPLKNTYGLTGKGVKVGIISSSFNLELGLEQNILSGDLPGPGNPFGFETPITILEEGLAKNIPFGIDEGRGMAQLVHDIAPEAEMFFHTGFVGSFLAYADAIQDLVDKGCNIIVDDVAIFGTGSYQINEISELIAEIKEQGVIYVSSAGNYGDGSSTNVFKFHEREYNPIGVNLAFGDFAVHVFENGEVVMPIDLPKGKSNFNLLVQWSAPWASRCEGCIGSEGFNIFIVFVDENQNIKAAVSPQRFGDAQVTASNVEFDEPDSTTIFALLLSPLNFTYLPERILLQHRPSTSTASINPDFSDLIFRNSPTILNHLNTDESIIVGASAWFNSPEGANYWNNNFAGTENPSGLLVDPLLEPEFPILSFEGAPGAVFNTATGNPITTRSSVGGIQMFFDERGLPLRPDAEGEALPVVYNKPDIVGSDGVTNTSFGVSNDITPNRFFFGTSASAPNVAGLVALLYQASNYTYGTDDMKRILINTAIDMDDPYINGFQASPDEEEFSSGFDFASGNGFVDASEAIELLIEEVGIEDISVEEVCSEDVLLGRRWELINPNGFAIEAKISSNRKFKLPTETEFARGTRTFLLPPDTSFILTDRSRFGTFTRFDVEANDADISRWISAPIPSCDTLGDSTSSPFLTLPDPNSDMKESKQQKPSLTVAPNPSSSTVTTATLGNLKDIPTEVQVLNMSGLLISSTDVVPDSDEYEVDFKLEEQQRGIYIVRVSAAEVSLFRMVIKN